MIANGYTIKPSANLRYADLRAADLREADLRSADLGGTYLREADLRSANLSWADLSLADLSGADLSGADLSLADLSGADLSGADLPLVGNMREIKSLQVAHFFVAYTATTLRIGCGQQPIAAWRDGSALADLNALSRKIADEHLPFLLDLIDRYPATPTGKE